MKKRFACLLLVFLLLPINVHAFFVDTSCWSPPDEEEEIHVPAEAHAFITLEALNLRPQPGTHAPRIALAPKGSIVYVTDFRDGEWYAVTYNGLSGYMFAVYLEAVDTEPPEPPTPPDLDNLAPVELIDWHTANELFKTRMPATVIDVRTGISWQVDRFGGELHADVETITAEDTANMHRAFNHTWTWEPRPIVIIIDGRTLAASIGGMPHGIVTNFRNNVNGHFCLHFFGSWAHGANNVDPRHHNAVMEAFFTAALW
jgi:hypothetical protein